MVAIMTPPQAERVAEREGMALDEFMRRQDEAPFEIIEGQVIEMSPSAFGSGDAASLLMEALFAYSASIQRLRIYSDTTFVLPTVNIQNWVVGSRIPDVMVYNRERIKTYRADHPDWRATPLRLVPDLAVEVVSPTDRLPKAWRKASIYLEDGVRLVWVINPMREVVTIFADGEAPITLDKHGVLGGGDVLPGLALNIGTLFEDV